MVRSQLYKVQQGQVPGPALQSQQHHSMPQGWGRVVGKVPGRREPWSTGQQPAECEPAMCPGGQGGQWHADLYQEYCGQQEQGGDRAPVLGTGKAPPQTLC